MYYANPYPPVFRGSTSAVPGRSGLVPPPSTEDQNKVLSGSGVYVVVPEVLILESWADLALYPTAGSNVPRLFDVIVNDEMRQYLLRAVKDGENLNGTKYVVPQDYDPARPLVFVRVSATEVVAGLLWDAIEQDWDDIQANWDEI